MDLYKTVEHAIQSKIGQEHYQYQQRRISPEELRRLLRISMILSIFISILSVYLSWSRNTMLGESTTMKIVYGFFAAMFGTTYLIFYYSRFLIETDMMKRLSLSGTEVFPRQMMIHDYLMV